MGDIDIGDFNKSRSFLIAWSCLVFSLWFFEADLTSFKLLGNEISLKRNQEHVWLLMAFVNFYLLLRYVQRLPKGFHKFSSDMDAIYNDLLCRDARSAHERNKEEGATSAGETIEYLKSKARMAYLDKDDAPTNLSREDRTRVELEHFYRVTNKSGDSKEQWGRTSWPVPSKMKAYFLKVTAVVIGAFTVSWFTDFFAPLGLGIASTFTAVCIWY